MKTSGFREIDFDEEKNTDYTTKILEVLIVLVTIIFWILWYYRENL